MKPVRSIGVVVGSLVLAAPLLAAAPPSKLEDKVQVTLVQVDALVIDKDGKTVPGLKQADFSMAIGGKPVAVEQLDELCPIGAAPDAVPLKDGAKAGLVAPGAKRRVVFAFDYAFLSTTMRPQVLDAAKAMLKAFKTDEEEVMIVALTWDVRIEQKFTKDVRQLGAALSRMKHDVTLFARDYPLGSTGSSYFGNFSALMDVLGAYDGAKAIVLFSQAGAINAAMRDSYFDDVTAHACANRVAIYPAKPELLTSAGSSPSLSRLANQTGGRMPTLSNDISIPYRSAQRDLSCRYTIATRLDPAAAQSPKQVSVGLSKPGLSIRAPERMQLFSDEARAASRARAAYIDPGPYEHPLVRAFAFSAVPAKGDKWDTLLAVNFPAPVGPAGAYIDVQAVLRQGSQPVEDYKRRIHVEPAPDGATSRVVTLMGDTPLKEGQYDLTVVLSDAKGSKLATAATPLIVPAVIPDLLTLRGPVLGRVVPNGLLLRAEPKEDADETRLGQLIGAGNGFEPMVVAQIDREDKLLFYWSACVAGKNSVPADAVVQRTILTEAGVAAHTFGPVPLKLEPKGKNLACLDRLESLPPSTLAAGDYTLSTAVVGPKGEVIAKEGSPLEVR